MKGLPFLVFSSCNPGNPQTWAVCKLKGRNGLVTTCFLLPSQVNNALLITHGAVSTLGLLLLHLAGTVQSSEDAGLELVGEEDRSRSAQPFFLLFLFQCAGSPLLLIPDPQLVFAAGVPCASVSKQLANRGSGGSWGRASAAQR